MKETKVVYMAAVKDLLAELEKLRLDVLAGEVQGWGGTVKFTDGREVAYIGGTFKSSTADQARAMLKVSALRMKTEDPPLRRKDAQADDSRRSGARRVRRPTVSADAAGGAQHERSGPMPWRVHVQAK
jgi:hypothetical protein